MKTLEVERQSNISADDYSQAAAALGISPSAAKQAAYRLRKRYRELFRAEVSRTIACEEDVDQEIGRLVQSLGYPSGLRPTVRHHMKFGFVKWFLGFKLDRISEKIVLPDSGGAVFNR